MGVSHHLGFIYFHDDSPYFIKNVAGIQSQRGAVMPITRLFDGRFRGRLLKVETPESSAWLYGLNRKNIHLFVVDEM